MRKLVFRIPFLVLIFIIILTLQFPVKVAAQELDANILFMNGEHRDDITLSGKEVLVLDNKEFKQFGNIYLKDSSKLIIRNATLQITRIRANWHSGIYPEDYSSLEIDNSILRPGEDTGFVVEAREFSHVSMKNSPTKVHLFSIWDNASAEVENSEILFDIGGAVGAFDRAFVKVKNSTIGAIVINVPPDATLFAEELDTGYFKEWSLQKNLSVSGINSNLILEDTELVPDDLEPGGFERSWTFFFHSTADSSANISIKNSNVRRIVFALQNETAEFSNLHLRVPTNYKYKNIELKNVTVSSQWGLFIQNGLSDVTVRDSEGLHTIISDNSKVTFINTMINEFNANNLHGEIIFRNSICVNPLIIIGSLEKVVPITGNNDFVIRGNCKIDPNLIPWTRWEDSNVTKFYDVLSENKTRLTLEKDGKIVWSGEINENGEAEFSIRVDDTTVMDKWILKDDFNHSVEVGFFSETPIKLENAKQEITNGFSIDSRILQLAIVAVIVLLILLTFLIKKRFK